MKTETLLDTTTHSGTLLEFVQARIQTDPNAEQLEAIGQEFYKLLENYVRDQTMQISLQHAMTFPRLDVENMNLISFLLWSFLYYNWTMNLFLFEREALLTAEFTWQ